MTHTSARIHEHAGRIAIHLEGVETLYLSVQLAKALATELEIASLQIKNGYHYSTKEIKG